MRIYTDPTAMKTMLKQSECKTNAFYFTSFDIHAYWCSPLQAVALNWSQHFSCLFTVEVYCLRMLCIVLLLSLCDCCKYVKYCVFSVYDFVYTRVNTFISLVQSVFKTSHVSVLVMLRKPTSQLWCLRFHFYVWQEFFFVKWNKWLQMMKRAWFIL